MSICKNCDTPLKGKYCYTCGQKEITEKDKRLLFILGEFFKNLTFYDSKFYVSLRKLVFAPGYLTNAYIEGKRNSYLKPIQLFLLINLIYFLAPFSVDMYYTRLKAHTKSFVYSNWAKEKVEEAVDELYNNNTHFFDDKAAAERYYHIQFNNLEQNYAKILILFNIFIFSLFLWLFNIGKKPNYYSEHFIFATHFYSFFVLALLTGIAGVAFSIIKILGKEPNEINDGIFSVIALLISLVYLIMATRKVYGDKRIWAIIKSILLIAGLIFSVMLYRYILFVLTYWLL